MEFGVLFSDVEKYIHFEKIIKIVQYSVHQFLLKNYLRKIWKTTLIDLIISKIKTKFAWMEKSFSRDLYLPLHKQIHIIAVHLSNLFQFCPMENC